ncbi:MAG: hypothetical protein ACRDTG_29605 [Pseudonocardiaceae bacterium]
MFHNQSPTFADWIAIATDGARSYRYQSQLAEVWLRLRTGCDLELADGVRSRHDSVLPELDEPTSRIVELIPRLGIPSVLVGR